MATYFDAVKDKIEDGIQGNALWIPSPYKRWKNKVGVKKKLYTLIGGDSGAGKSSFVDSTYILHTYEWYMRNKDHLKFKPKIILRSMERSKEFRIAKWICYLLYSKFNILVDVKTLFGLHAGDSRIDSDIMKKIESCREYIENMQQYITVIDGRSVPWGVFKDFRNYSLKHGTIYRHNGDGSFEIGEYKESDRKIVWKSCPKDRFPSNHPFPEKYETVFIADDENEIVIPVVDHIGKYKNRKGDTNKDTLDRASDYTSDLRDIFGMSPINISQFNRSKTDTKRRFNKRTELQPEEDDFKGSGDMYEDADLVIGLFNPYSYGINNHFGYSISKFVNSYGYNRFRSAFVLKNSYGPDDFMGAFQFIGEIGRYRLMPKPKQLNKSILDKIVNTEQQDKVIDLVKR